MKGENHMDQIKIGRFIKQKRKEKGMTQSKLAEKLGVTDRAISKWENGNCMPDSGIIADLCKILNVTINDLFSGEVVDMKDNEKKLEENLLEITKLKQDREKQLMNLEIFIGILAAMVFLICAFVASFVNIENIYKILLVVLGLILFLVGCIICLRIEQTVGYYECKRCHYRYIPTYSNILYAMHIGRTRYMKCPKCHKYSWNRKVISRKNEDD